MSRYQEHIQKIVFGALFLSIATVVKILFSYIPVHDIAHSDIYLVIIMLGGILLGPFHGAVIGIFTDILFITLRGGDWGLYTLAHFFAGFIPGLYFSLFKYNKINVAACTLLTMILYVGTTMFANYFYGWIPVLNWVTVSPSVIRYSILTIPYIFLLHLLVIDPRLKDNDIYRRFRNKHRR